MATTTAPVRRPTVGTTSISFARQSLAGLRVLLVLTVLLGVVYPLAVTGVSWLTMRWQSNGSLLSADGRRTSDRGDAGGSPRVGLAFEGPTWFHPRPSAAGDGYDTLASAGSNLGPNDLDLVAAVAERRAGVAAAEGVDPAAVPPDALTASASGLDPEISPQYARLQVERVARENGLPRDEVAALVEEHVVGRDLGFLGEPRVNVLRLNLALRTMAP